MATHDRSWLPKWLPDQSQIWHRPEFRTPPGLGAAPNGFPDFINSELVWSGPTFQDDRDQYYLNLDDAQIHEIEDAADRYEAQELPVDQISKQTFPLPKLGPVLTVLAGELASGRGFFALRGINPNQYSTRKNIIIYVGISSYIGSRRGRQDEYGNMLLHLTDLGPTVAPDNERQAPYSSVGQPFHTDNGSILGLFALGKAAHGGESKLVSSWKIYNEMRQIRPDLVRALAADDWAFDSFGQNPPFQTRPLIHLEDHRVIFSFSRRPLLGSATSPRSSNVPDLSDKQVEALNLVQLLAEQHALVLDLEPGDMLFWNNLGVLHARNGFTDSEKQRRHLVRIWLHNDELGWSIPQAIRATWEEAFGYQDQAELWPLEPITDRAYVSTQQRQSGHG